MGKNTNEALQGIQQWLKPETGKYVVFYLNKLKGGLFIVIGYLLSPLSWWNDLFFNLPIAYGFGRLCSWFFPDVLLPAAIVGYWLSNIAGILLMQFGALSVFQEQSAERNLKKELLGGLLSSTVYTVIILTLFQLNILHLPELFAGESSLNFGSLFTGLTP